MSKRVQFNPENRFSRFVAEDHCNFALIGEMGRCLKTVDEKIELASASDIHVNIVRRSGSNGGIGDII